MPTKTTRSQSCLPDSASKQSTWSACLLLAGTLSGLRNGLPPAILCLGATNPSTGAPITSAVRNTRLPKITGEESPLPGKPVFQATFSAALQDSGKFFNSETPFCVGPRHPGQSSEVAAGPASMADRVNRSVRASCIVSLYYTSLEQRTMVVVPTSRAAWEVLLARKRSSFLWLVFLGTFAAAQSLSPFRIQKLTAGSAPAGVSVTPIQSALQTLPVYAVVANSGSNSVSIFELYSGGSPLVNVTNTYTVPVPGPYAVATCTNKMDARAVVTSPGDHSISVLSLPTGTLLGKVALGSVAYSADCYWDGTAYKAVVSTRS